MTITSTNRKKPSKAARQAAGRIRNTKAELLDTITAQDRNILELEKRADALRKTVLGLTRAIAQITDAGELRVLRLKMMILIRRQLEKRLRVAIGELVAYFERPHHHGYVHAEMARINAIRELAE